LFEETGENAKSNFMKNRWPPGVKENPKPLEYKIMRVYIWTAGIPRYSDGLWLDAPISVL
jgi:hypothetical protein